MAVPKMSWTTVEHEGECNYASVYVTVMVASWVRVSVVDSSFCTEAEPYVGVTFIRRVGGVMQNIAKPGTFGLTTPVAHWTDNYGGCPVCNVMGMSEYGT